jgi:hypothetical protein
VAAAAAAATHTKSITGVGVVPRYGKVDRAAQQQQLLLLLLLLQCSLSCWQAAPWHQPTCSTTILFSTLITDNALLLVLVAAAIESAVLTLKVVICPLAAAYILKCLRSVEAPLADKMPTAPLASILEMGIKFVAAKAD